jgi:hypothetical protein
MVQLIVARLPYHIIYASLQLWFANVEPTYFADRNAFAEVQSIGKKHRLQALANGLGS